MAKNILSIDGGGYRGLFPALILKFIEKETGKRISELFDLVVGTSTGGIIALSINSNISAEEICNFYIEEGPNIFKKDLFRNIITGSGFFASKYDRKKTLDPALKKIFKNEKFGDIKNKTMICSFDMNNMEPIVFKNYKERFKKVLTRTVAGATSAAPSFFDPVGFEKNRALIDGGIIANNPALLAYVEAKKLFPNEQINLLSLGTLIKEYNYEIKYLTNKGLLFWGRMIVNLYSAGASETDNYILNKVFLNDDLGKYLRIQIESNEDKALDDTSKEVTKYLESFAELAIRENGEKILKLILNE